jgi:hypothetical protein
VAHSPGAPASPATIGSVCAAGISRVTASDISRGGAVAEIAGAAHAVDVIGVVDVLIAIIIGGRWIRATPPRVLLAAPPGVALGAPPGAPPGQTTVRRPVTGGPGGRMSVRQVC